MKEIRFIHTADLHLDSPFRGLGHLPKPLVQRLRESTFTAFQNVIDAAIEKKVDFVLICGDLYDGEDRSIKAQARLRKQLQRLEESGISVFMIHGNHDHLDGGWISLDMPGNVRIFSEKVESVKWIGKNGVSAYVYGFSYPKRHVYSRKIAEYKRVEGVDFHIAMLHGSEEGQGGTHQPYAPFSVDELLKKTMDYWALGHIHQKQILHSNPYIVYPGNIQGRHQKEYGEKGCYFVVLKEAGETEVEFIETADIRWESIDIHIREGMDLTQLFNECIKEMESLRSNKAEGVLCSLTLHQADLLLDNVLRTIENEEFLEMLQDNADFEGAFVWPYKIHATMLHSSSVIDEKLADTIESIVLELKSDGLDEAIADLYSHTYGSRYLDAFTEQELDEILYSAQKLVIDSISRMK
ncbi:DNA repair exonuclease SbcCD nuclease subunit [Bacillus thermophilus]|uniref:DNA repair exonuclease SbcCD nuclease subunit n=1 Tax=Siminovitchia thermophila TaxID=1245522 RepID=A0ABS2R617_9BACI|nr:DNA repair exonuclease [Siminovitchia thermophila]MBM7715083.1 DNA repair exonuclease SbcCD nuclease subunit [Siminovitchia thermophila]